ncbi:MAG: hypothetical protein Q8Q02_00660, partial [Nocardioides sp.]|nr:hypothetical protein [Nocardioides sp.]
MEEILQVVVGGVFVGKAMAREHAARVGVDDEDGAAGGVEQNGVGRFGADAGEGEKLGAQFFRRAAQQARDQHPAPIDPHFTGVGRTLTDAEGHYRFTTIKPGPYPWKNHYNAWRPAHVHFSLFGSEFTQRMVTQMYFPGDPLFALDPIYQSIVDPAARDRLVATYDHNMTSHEWATGYVWDIVLTGSHRTPLDEEEAT